MTKLEKRVPFDMCDPVGILFYGSIFTLAHQCLEEALPKIGISWEDWFTAPIGAPVRHVDCNFFKPIKANQILNVELSFEDLTDSSFQEHYEFKTDNQTHCILKIRKVFVDRQKMTKTKMPNQIRKCLEAS